MPGSTRVLPICTECSCHNLPARRFCCNCGAELRVGIRHSASSAQADRRKFPRRGVPRLSVILSEVGGRRVPGELYDFSLGGCRVAATINWEAGTELRLALEDGSSGRWADVVLRNCDRDLELENTVWNMGFEFLSPTPTFPGSGLMSGGR